MSQFPVKSVLRLQTYTTQCHAAVDITYGRSVRQCMINVTRYRPLWDVMIAGLPQCPVWCRLTATPIAISWPPRHYVLTYLCNHSMHLTVIFWSVMQQRSVFYTVYHIEEIKTMIITLKKSDILLLPQSASTTIARPINCFALTWPHTGLMHHGRVDLEGCGWTAVTRPTPAAVTACTSHLLTSPD